MATETKGTKINVGCKLPNGLVLEHMGVSVELVGSNDPRAIAGFGVTRDVDGDWFKAWASTDGQHFPALKNGSIFELDKDAEGHARDQAQNPDAMTGQEPIDPLKPGNGVEPTPETVKELEKAGGTGTKTK